jgi:signal transduction histidine kinase
MTTNTNNHPTFHPSIMSQISHELRIPLTGILGMAQILAETKLTAVQKEYLQVILSSAQRLLALEDKLKALVEEGSW